MPYFYVFKNQEEASEFIAEFTACTLEKFLPYRVTLGTATGSTFEGVYKGLRERADSLSNVAFVRQMDNYYQGLIAGNDDRRKGYEKEIWESVAKYIPGVDFDIPNEYAYDLRLEIERYKFSRRRARENSRFWMQYVGIGGDGHIAFNEPFDDAFASVHYVELDEQTIADNARFFAGSQHQVPRGAITSGVNDILSDSDLIVFAAFGEQKANVIKNTFRQEIGMDIPATLLRLFARDLVCVFDEAAASEVELCPEELCMLSPEDLSDEVLIKIIR